MLESNVKIIYRFSDGVNEPHKQILLLSHTWKYRKMDWNIFIPNESYKCDNDHCHRIRPYYCRELSYCTSSFNAHIICWTLTLQRLRVVAIALQKWKLWYAKVSPCRIPTFLLSKVTCLQEHKELQLSWHWFVYTMVSQFITNKCMKPTEMKPISHLK